MDAADKIMMHKVWRSLVLRKHRVEMFSSLRYEVAMRKARVVPGKHGMSALMISLKESKTKSEAIKVHIYQGNTEKQQLKDKDEKTTVMVH